MNRPSPQSVALSSAALLGLLLSPALVLAAPGSAGAPAATPPHAHAAAASPAQTAAAAPRLHAALRALWHDHVVQTRAYAMALKSGNTTYSDEAAQNVVANARQIADAVAGFYGPAAGKQMLTLLAGHWGAVKAMTDAQQRGDTTAARKAMTTLVANADAIATFLSGANPYLGHDAVQGLLLAHGAHHDAQIRQIMAGDTAGEATTWKAMQAHMDTIADALAGAIARQFPDKAD